MKTTTIYFAANSLNAEVDQFIRKYTKKNKLPYARLLAFEHSQQHIKKLLNYIEEENNG